MKPIKASWCNVIMGAGQEDQGIIPVPAHKDRDGKVTIGWELSEEEIRAIVETKTIYTMHYTDNRPMQPVNIWVNDKDGKAIETNL